MPLGAYSEVGRLRRVMVHRPGLEHTRLTPSNAEELLFDDVLWVARAKADNSVEQRWRTMRRCIAAAGRVTHRQTTRAANRRRVRASVQALNAHNTNARA